MVKDGKFQHRLPSVGHRGAIQQHLQRWGCQLIQSLLALTIDRSFAIDEYGIHATEA